MTKSLELPESVYDALIEVAKARGIAPSEWIAARLPRKLRKTATESARELPDADGRPAGTDRGEG